MTRQPPPDSPRRGGSGACSAATVPRRCAGEATPLRPRCGRRAFPVLDGGASARGLPCGRLSLLTGERGPGDGAAHSPPGRWPPGRAGAWRWPTSTLRRPPSTPAFLADLGADLDACYVGASPRSRHWGRGWPMARAPGRRRGALAGRRHGWGAPGVSGDGSTPLSALVGPRSRGGARVRLRLPAPAPPAGAAGLRPPRSPSPVRRWTGSWRTATSPGLRVRPDGG